MALSVRVPPSKELPCLAENRAVRTRLVAATPPGVLSLLIPKESPNTQSNRKSAAKSRQECNIQVAKSEIHPQHTLPKCTFPHLLPTSNKLKPLKINHNRQNNMPIGHKSC
jgi:hypothetical protein